MLPSNLDSLTPTQRLIVEQAYVMAQELEAAADSAPEGRAIDRCESFLLGNGRDFLRKVLESTLQTRVEVLEKKGVPPESAVWGVGARQRKRDQNGDDRWERSFFGVPISPAIPVVWGVTRRTVFSAWRVSSRDKRHA